MKKLLLLIPFLLFFILNVKATDYYLSASGNDANSGTTSSAPWKTLNKVNANMSKFGPGDRILFRRGDTFYGQLAMTKSGTSGSPITLTAFGSGALPVISGFTTIDSWNSIGGNIWESSTSVSSLETANMVVFGNVNTAMGRWPNNDYITYESFSGNNSITSKGLSGSLNWKGAEAVIRKQRWIIDRNIVTSQSGNTLNYSPSSQYDGQVGYGFFIQNDPRTLDKQNEWYYNPSTKKLRVFSSQAPKDVKIASVNTLLTLRVVGNITIENLSFEGSNERTIDIGSSANIVIRNCELKYAGIDAIYGAKNYGKPSSGFRFENNTIDETNNNAMLLQTEFAGALISHNTIKNSGMLVGMGQSSDHTYEGIRTRASNVIIEYNDVDGVGHNGIAFYFDNVIVRNNFVRNTCAVKLDGAAIYTFIGSGNTPSSGQKVLDNIVLGGPGSNNGTSATGNPISHGIYMDEYATGVEIARNTIANFSHTGLHINRVANLNIHDNTVYNNGVNQILFNSFGTKPLKPINGVKMNDNIFVAKDADQIIVKITTKYDDAKQMGTFNNNIYARPVDDNITMNVWINNATFHRMTLDQWKTYMNQDKNSIKSPKAITNVNDLRFEYNAGPSSKTIRLDGKYIDMNKVAYNGSITLAPYSSAILIRNGAIENMKPTADAGSDQIINLPTNTTVLNGNGRDDDGQIVSYVWSKISGPSGGSISTPQSNNTNVTSLVEGIYKFSLKVTDNAGATDIDTCEISVKSSITVYDPVANAGNDQTISLPKNTAQLSGSAYVQGGKIVSYQWTKVSGPSGGTIENSTQEETVVSNLIVGTYVYQIEATDNAGKKANSKVKIEVVEKNDLLPSVNPLNTENGLDYNYYEENSFKVLPDFQYLSPVKSGKVSNFIIEASNRENSFAYKYSGYIEVPQDGQYTFYTTSDDGSSLYIDGIKVVDNDGIHWNRELSGSIGLKAGKHTISVEYFQETGGKILNVNYAGPGISKRVIPSNSLYRISDSKLLPSINPGEIVQGLDYKYYEQNTFQILPDFSKLTPVKSGSNAGFDIDISSRTNVFAYKFEGFINISQDGMYDFFTTSDDGSKLYIDEVEVVNNDGIHFNKEISGSIGLKAGFHKISVEYFQETGGKMLSVAFAGPGISKRAIAETSLFRPKNNGFLSAINPINIERGLTYSYYEESTFKVLPDYSKINPVKKGKVNDFDISIANRINVFAFKFTGYIDIPADGEYTFYTTSDDGSNLYIDGIKVIDNDGIHFNREMSGTLGLRAGKHSITVDYFQETGGKILNVAYAGPGISKRSIPASSLWTDVGFNQPLSRVGILNDPSSSISEVVKVFPNPFLNHITVSLTGKAGKYEISLVDVNGKVLWIKSGNKGDGFYQQSFDVNSIQRGIYFIRINNGDKISTIKVVK